MIKSKISIVVAILAASIVSPALAQSPDHTGSQMPYYYDNTGGQVRGAWGPQDTAVTSGPILRSHTLYGYAPQRHNHR
jgi:hypothetical protein